MFQKVFQNRLSSDENSCRPFLQNTPAFYRNTPGIDENTPAFSRFVIPKFVFCCFFATFVKNVVCIQEKFFRRIMTISLNIAK